MIPGGTGQLGTILARSFHGAGDEVVVLGRSPRSSAWREIGWDPTTLGPWAEEVDGADVVINLAGRSVNCRYTPRNRREIMRSRVVSTRLVGEAIARSRRPPSLWLQASTATIYAHGYERAHGEVDGVIGGNEPDVPASWSFSVDVARAWEHEVDAADVAATRRVKLRTSMVMSPDRGGIFDTMLALVRRGLGGRAGDGRQFVSWIHDADFVRSVQWLIDNPEVDDVVNVTAPDPVPHAIFMREMRRAWGTRIGLPATRWMLELGALLLRTESELPLKSRRVVPGVLAGRGFEFHFPQWGEAARDLCERWRADR